MCLLRKAELKLLVPPVNVPVWTSASQVFIACQLSLLRRSNLRHKEMLVGVSSAVLFGGS